MRIFAELASASAFEPLGVNFQTSLDEHALRPFPGIILHADDFGIALRKLELREIFRSDVMEMRTARAQAGAIHRTSDVDAAGDEVEIAVRRVLERKLPRKFDVGHGHIVDSDWSASPQFDVIVTERDSPCLLRTENGTGYFPIESVYAIGEIKSTYRKSELAIGEFVQKLAKVHRRLRRNGMGMLQAETPKDPKHPAIPRFLKSPFFSFIIFVDAGNFDGSHISDMYRQIPQADLPSVLCMLGKGIVQRSLLVNSDAPGQTYERSIFIDTTGRGQDGGYEFSALCAALIGHLQSVSAVPAPLVEYFTKVFEGEIKMQVFW